MKIQLALALLLASAVAHAEDPPYSDNTPPAETNGSMIGVGQSPAAGAESVGVGGDDQQCNSPEASFIDQFFSLIAGSECEAQTTSSEMESEVVPANR